MIDNHFIDAIAALNSKGTHVKLIEKAPGELAGRLFHLAVPTGISLQDVTAQILKSLPNPQHREGIKKLASMTSFIDFVCRMAEPSTVLFANPATSTITAVFDYHDSVNTSWMAHTQSTVDIEADVNQPPPAPLPRWGRFRAEYAFPLAADWKTWATENKNPMSQTALASFIEDNIINVNDTAEVTQLVSPRNRELIGELGLRLAGRATLLGAARGLSIKVKEKLGTIVNTQSGEISVNYEQIHARDGVPVGENTKVDVPSAFTIVLPVYEGAAPFELLVRLRYRKADGALKWHFDVYNIQRAIQMAFEEGCRMITENTGILLYYVAD